LKSYTPPHTVMVTLVHHAHIDIIKLTKANELMTTDGRPPGELLTANYTCFLLVYRLTRLPPPPPPMTVKTDIRSASLNYTETSIGCVHSTGCLCIL